MRKYVILASIVLAILFIIVFFDLHVSPTKAVKTMLQAKDISFEKFKVVNNENSKFYIINDHSTLILVKVSRTMGLFWTSDYSHFYGTNSDPIDYNIFSSVSYTIIYGICNDSSIHSVELITSNGKNIKSDIDGSGLFAIKYDGNALLWKQLLALDENSNKIWSLTN